MPQARKQSTENKANSARRNAKASAQEAVKRQLKKVWRPVESKKLFSEKNKSGTTKYRLHIGYDKKGKQIKPSFGEDKSLAYIFQEKWNHAVQNNDQVELNILSDVSQIDVRYALVELEKVNATLREAVNFYLLHALPEGGFLNWEQAVDKYYEIQKEKNLAPASSDKKHKNYRTFFKPIRDYFAKKKLLETTVEDVKKYLIKRGENWNERTYNDHLNYGRRLWNVLAEAKYCTEEINPFDQLPRKRKKVKRGSKKIMLPREVKHFFLYVERQAKIDNTKYQELALMTLTFFCGIRIEEVSKCEWGQIKTNNIPQEEDDTNWTITVWGDQEKTSMAKVNPISSNAKHWLSICKKHRDKKRKKIVSDNFADRMKKLRKAFKKEMMLPVDPVTGKKKNPWPIDIPQNTARHCFCSYHLGKYNDYPLTTQRMKHGNVSTLKSNYEAVVNPKEAKEFFNILPANVSDRQKDLSKESEQNYWEEQGIPNVNNQKYYQRLLNAAKRNFIKAMVEKGVPEIEADEAILNDVEVRAGDENFLFNEKEILWHFVNQIQGKGFKAKGPRQIDQKILSEHLKFMSPAFFKIEDASF